MPPFETLAQQRRRLLDWQACHQFQEAANFFLLAYKTGYYGICWVQFACCGGCLGFAACKRNTLQHCGTLAIRFSYLHD